MFLVSRWDSKKSIEIPQEPSTLPQPTAPIQYAHPTTQLPFIIYVQLRHNLQNSPDLIYNSTRPEAGLD